MLRNPLVLLMLGMFFVPLAHSHVKAQPLSPQSESESDAYREQSIYIPYDKLRQTFEKEGRGVFLPYEKFQELWKAARNTQPHPRPIIPPFKAVITEIASEANVENDVVRVTALVMIDVLGKGWIEVPLRLSDAAVLSATIDDKPALLVAGADGQQNLLLHHDGGEGGAGGDSQPIELRLEYAKSISKAPGQNSVAFEAPQAPINRWRIRIPESGVKVHVHPMLAATEVPSFPASAGDAILGSDELAGGESASPSHGETSGRAEETVVLAFVGATKSVRIDWTPKAEGASGLDALVNVQTEQQVTIDEGLIRTQTLLTYEISRAELPQLRIEVPADEKVVNVTDANVRQWNVEANGPMQSIIVGLFQPAREHQTVAVELEKFHNDASLSVSVPAVKAVDAGRQHGVVVVRLADGLRAEPVRRSALMQLDANEIADHLRGTPWAFAYRYVALPFDLALRLDKIQPRIDVDQLVEVFLEPRKLTIGLVAKYTIQRAGVFEFELEVPDGFQVRLVRGYEATSMKAAVVDSFVVAAGQKGISTLKVNLASKAQGEVGLVVEMERRLDDVNLLSPTGQSSQIDIVPARVAAESVQRATGRMVVYAPESLRVAIEQLEGLRNISFEQAFGDSASIRNDRFGDLRPVQAMAFSQAPASVRLAAQRRRPQVTVRQLLVTRIDPGAVKYEATFFFDIRYSGVKSLRIDVPAELADRVRNETPGMRETVMDPPPEDLADGYVAWDLAGEAELLGPQQCKLTWETAIANLGIGESVALTVPRLIPRGVDRSDGQIVLVKAETIDVQPEGQPEGLDPIDPQHDLISGIRIADAAAALEFHDAWNLTLAATRYQLESLKHTSIEQAVLRMVITRSDRLSMQALYRMRSNRQRLEIRLPEEVGSGKIEFDTDPLRINGRRATLERGDDSRTFFVPLTEVTPNEPFVLELRYTAPGGNRLAYPAFPHEPAVQLVNLVAYLPEEVTYLGKRGPWTDQTTWIRNGPLERRVRSSVDVHQLISGLTRGIDLAGNPADDFPTDGRPLLFSTLRPPSPDTGALRLTTLNSQLWHGLVFGLVAFTGVLLLRRPAVDRMALVFGGVAALLIAGVFLPTFVDALFSYTFMLAVTVVALLWLASFSIHTLPKLGRLRLRWPRPRKSRTNPSETVPAEKGGSSDA